MSYKPIQLKNISFVLNHKTCFEGFDAQIQFGDRIALLGNNGSGKSTLLKIIMGLIEPTFGSVITPNGVTFGYVPQIIETFGTASGGQRFNKALTQELIKNPDVLILDEPTNHLDQHNRKSLFKMLRAYEGILIIATHDVELLSAIPNILWHIDNGAVHVTSSSYDDYMREKQRKRLAIEQKLTLLNRKKTDLHESLMKEQARASKNNAYGEKMRAQGRWQPIMAGAKQNQANNTTGKKKGAINTEKQALLDQLGQLRIPEIIKPTFSLSAADVGAKMIVSVREGSVGYDAPLVANINFSLMSGERIVIKGSNGAGKTTLIKALFGDAQVARTGEWITPQAKEIGYLDQHYATLDQNASVMEVIKKASGMNDLEARKHLNDFLFRKNEEVAASVKNLSGGEKARLCLALISACTPRLLVLDEITNNVDLETREHIIQVLKEYPGAMIVISHDQNFLDRLELSNVFEIQSDRG